jgi:signal transduction histidine kinase
VAPGEGLLGRVFAEDRPGRIWGQAALQDPFLKRFPVWDAVAVPVRVGGKPAGVLFAGRHEPRRRFAPADSLVLLIAADRIATALGQVPLVDEIARHGTRLRALQDFSGATLLAADDVSIQRRGCEAARRVVGAEWALLALREPSGDLMVAEGSSAGAGPAEGCRYGANEGLGGAAISTREAVACEDIAARTGGTERMLRDVGARGCLALPVLAGEQLLGILYVGDLRPRRFSPQEMDAARMLASLVGVALESARVHREVRAALEAATTGQERLVQAEKARALAEMAGGIAHEFNNILAIVLGKTQLMLARTSDESVREGLGIIEEAAWRAADIVRRLQGFAATGAEEVTGQAQLNDLVQEAVSQTRPQWKDEAEARGVAVEVVTDLGDLPAVQGNAVALREVVANLLANAVDAMPRGGRVTLSTRARGDWVRLAVQDTGEGLTEDVKRRLFEPFFTTRTPLRTGLGLSVVHGIVSRHRGRIEVESEPGRGSTFTVWLPAAPITAPTRPAETPAPPASTPSVLVLEDEDRIRGTLVEALTGAGYRVDSAGDGRVGLQRFQAGRFDVVLTDLSLPEGSGLDVAKSIKRTRPGTPVILMTGWGHLLDPARLREAGVDLMLVKPFRIERVLGVLTDALRMRKSS